MKRTIVLFALFLMAAMLSFAQTRGAIVFHRDGYRPYFAFDAKNYYRSGLGGYVSLVDAIEAKVPENLQIQELGLEYHRGATMGATLEMAGLLTTLGVAGYRVYQHINPGVIPHLALSTALIIDASAVASELFGYSRAGPPRRLVAYYNQRYAVGK